MSRIKTLFVLGIWIAILPYLGFPSSWKNILITLSGLGLAFLSYLIRREERIVKKEKTFDNFSENGNFKEETSAEEKI
ncbi:hypothetical protein A3G06_02560 [Candidatus Nomurabacteria bacterium RIFCSPLOWO2_12_FULL_46_14]|uniref:Uncharacterized protein n=1 Tax=Candidatus Nomurabacteria bacterium RIFCSPLOWO2_12_FULL_46_14 TaxID=1801797 RepID=A0A1F6YBT3_9BACT|nr:MAG: hypothetical protein A3G06_02560 [Candidatus Nomurabacteria bacterium RIFCSPLOWO2_12_FULL_46_14]